MDRDIAFGSNTLYAIKIYCIECRYDFFRYMKKCRKIDDVNFGIPQAFRVYVNNTR